MITGDLLPSSAMIKELSQEFGMPTSQEDLTERQLLAVAPAPSLEGFQSRKSALASAIHSHQERYLQWRNNVILKSRVQKPSLIRVGAPPPRCEPSRAQPPACVSSAAREPRPGSAG